jgi:hypothetical protein
MEFLDFSEVVLTKQFLDHVCFGEPGDTGKGGHIFGTKREGKTEFPDSWGEHRIHRALQEVLQRPQYVEFLFPKVYLRRNIAGVLVEILLMDSPKGLIPHAAYPLFGEGVVLNILGNQHHIPRFDSRKGK